MHNTNHPAFRKPVISQACDAIRGGEFDEAILLLTSSESYLPDAEKGFALNLLGVAHEGQRRWNDARRCYGKAIAADKRLAAAQQNMRRIYELHAFGASNEPVALGEHEMLVRASLESSLMRRGLVSTAT